VNRMLVGIGLTAALVVGVSACGDDDKSSSSKDPITITDTWARTSPMNAANGAAYMTIVSSAADTLMSASVEPSVAAKVELHETVAVEGSPTESTGMTESTAMPGATTPAGGGAMEMRPVDSIALEAGTPLVLMPGGYHIMLLDLVNPLTTGSTIALTLNFEKAGAMTITVPVSDEAP